jgi:hypothetical protein
VKILWMIFLMLAYLPLSFAGHEKLEKAVIKSIDDYALPKKIKPSEKAFPEEYFLHLLDDLYRFENTVISDSRARYLFNQLTRDPKARMEVAGGKCSYRRSYIQKYLRNLEIDSSRLLIQCPGNNGRLRLQDQVTGRRYTFSNFHDTNVVSVETSVGVGLKVMDVQFKEGPLSLSRYLAEIEASQKIKPLGSRLSSDRGYCYWSVK